MTKPRCFQRGFVFSLVREVGLEPTRHCCRQDLNLVRLPISPLTRVYAASLKRVRERGETCNPCPTTSYPSYHPPRFCNFGKATFPATQGCASRPQGCASRQARHSNRIDAQCLHTQYARGRARREGRQNSPDADDAKTSNIRCDPSIRRYNLKLPPDTPNHIAWHERRAYNRLSFSFVHPRLKSPR